uniref:Uncharacterized protein n=1 Tax=Rhizophora mucronata TaxID=61149 RepID=A0A2P2IXN2_RHIMU
MRNPKQAVGKKFSPRENVGQKTKKKQREREEARSNCR